MANYYSDRLTGEAQLEAEEALALLIADSTTVDEAAAQDIARRALKLVLVRFRPDLIVDELELELGDPSERGDLDDPMDGA